MATRGETQRAIRSFIIFLLDLDRDIDASNSKLIRPRNPAVISDRVEHDYISIPFMASCVAFRGRSIGLAPAAVLGVGILMVFPLPEFRVLVLGLARPTGDGHPR